MTRMGAATMLASSSTREIISDLAASSGAIREFDFGNGDSLHKERLSTGSRLEGYFYLIPSDFKGSRDGSVDAHDQQGFGCAR